jgi:hypothetical protein
MEQPVDNVERVARVLCVRDGRDPEGLEPGNIAVQTTWDEQVLMDGDYDHLVDNGTIPPDGHDGKDPCHYNWREYIFTAQAVIGALEHKE